MSDDTTKLVGRLPRGAAGPVADLLTDLAGRLRQRASADRQRLSFDQMMVETVRRTTLRDVAGHRFERDRDIMQRARAGWSNADIARDLGISASTVSRTIARVKATVQERQAQLARIRSAASRRPAST